MSSHRNNHQACGVWPLAIVITLGAVHTAHAAEQGAPPKAKGGLLVTLQGPGGEGASFSRDGTKLLTFNDRSVQVWNTSTWKPIGAPLVHGEGLRAAQFDADAKLVLTQGHAATQTMRVVRGHARVWNIQTSDSPIPPITHGGWPVSGAAISPDGRYVVTCSRHNKQAFLWSTADGSLVRRFSHGERIEDVQIVEQGWLLITTGQTRGNAGCRTRIWDLESAALRHDLPAKGGYGPFWVLARPAVSASGHIAIATLSGFDVYQLSTGRLIFREDKHSRVRTDILSLSISPNGKVVFAGYDFGQGRCWNVEKGELIDKRVNSSDWAPAFDPEGSVFAFGVFDDLIGVWDVRTHERARLFASEPAWGAAVFSPDGDLIAWSRRKSTIIYAARPGVTGLARWSP